ncbi:MAG: DUF4013 domain-containing protein [Vulcanimicrobiota bacterium]
MLKNLKAALLYPATDPTRVSKVGQWWLFCLLFFTTPALLGHYVSVIKQSFQDPQETEVPGFNRFDKLFFSGIALYAGFAFLQLIPGLPNFTVFAINIFLSKDSEPGFLFFLCFGIHLSIMLAALLLWPALCMQYAESGWLAMFKLKEVLGKALLCVREYLFLVVYPFLAWLILMLLCVTVVGIVLLIPAIPFLVIGHARLIGLYMHQHLS